VNSLGLDGGALSVFLGESALMELTSKTGAAGGRSLVGPRMACADNCLTVPCGSVNNWFERVMACDDHKATGYRRRLKGTLSKTIGIKNGGAETRRCDFAARPSPTVIALCRWKNRMLQSCHNFSQTVNIFVWRFQCLRSADVPKRDILFRQMTLSLPASLRRCRLISLWLENGTNRLAE